jgi:MYXO-CTERM domain-containing protein
VVSNRITSPTSWALADSGQAFPQKHRRDAVYGYDGENWLSWTMEGWNADMGSTTGGSDDTGLDINPGEGVCGCTGSPAAPWAALVALVPFLRRRRR